MLWSLVFYHSVGIYSALARKRVNNDKQAAADDAMDILLVFFLWHLKKTEPLTLTVWVEAGCELEGPTVRACTLVGSRGFQEHVEVG